MIYVLIVSLPDWQHILAYSEEGAAEEAASQWLIENTSLNSVLEWEEVAEGHYEASKRYHGDTLLFTVRMVELNGG